MFKEIGNTFRHLTKLNDCLDYEPLRFRWDFGFVWHVPIYVIDLAQFDKDHRCSYTRPLPQSFPWENSLGLVHFGFWSISCFRGLHADKLRFGAKMNTARKQHVISCVWYISLSRDWLSHFGFLIITHGTVMGNFFCSFWRIHGNFPEAIITLGKSVTHKKLLPSGKEPFTHG